MNIKHNRRGIKADFRDNTIDKDAVRELVLVITNDGDQYRRQITPAIENLKKKYKKGTYDRDLAVKLWQYVADEGVRRYNKEYGSGTYSVAWLNPATRKAIAEELRDYYEDEIMYEPPVEASTRRRPIKAAEGLNGMKIIAQENAHVEVYEDEYDRGAGQYVNSWSIDVIGEYSSIESLIYNIANTVYAFSDDINDYYFLDGALHTSAVVNNDNEEPTEDEWNRWKAGEEKLYFADLWIPLGVGSIHEMTEDEAEAFGLSLY